MFLHSEQGSAPRLALVAVPDMKRFRNEGVQEVGDTLRFEVTNIANELPTYQRPARIFPYMSELPKTRLGKIRRHLIPGIVAGAKEESGDGEELSEAMGTVERLVAGYLGRKFVRQEQHLEVDLGLDSLGRMDLQSYLEMELSIRLPADAAASVSTVGDVVEVFSNPLCRPDEVREADIKIPKLCPVKLLIQLFADLLVWVYLKLKMNFPNRREQNIPETGAFLIAPNHLSLLDALVLRASLPRPLRYRVMYLSIGRYFESFLLRPVAWAARIIVIGRKYPPALAFLILQKALKEGNPVVVFPEGERSPNGRLQQPKKGTFRLAVETGCDVYPAAIKGTYGFFSRGGKPHKNPVVMTILPPITMDGLIGGLKEEGEGDPKTLEKLLADRWVRLMKEHLGE